MNISELTVFHILNHTKYKKYINTEINIHPDLGQITHSP